MQRNRNLGTWWHSKAKKWHESIIPMNVCSNDTTMTLTPSPSYWNCLMTVANGNPFYNPCSKPVSKLTHSWQESACHTNHGSLSHWTGKIIWSCNSGCQCITHGTCRSPLYLNYWDHGSGPYPPLVHWWQVTIGFVCRTCIIHQYTVLNCRCGLHIEIRVGS